MRNGTDLDDMAFQSHTSPISLPRVSCALLAKTHASCLTKYHQFWANKYILDLLNMLDDISNEICVLLPRYGVRKVLYILAINQYSMMSNVSCTDKCFWLYIVSKLYLFQNEFLGWVTQDVFWVSLFVWGNNTLHQRTIVCVCVGGYSLVVRNWIPHQSHSHSHSHFTTLCQWFVACI